MLLLIAMVRAKRLRWQSIELVLSRSVHGSRASLGRQNWTKSLLELTINLFAPKEFVEVGSTAKSSTHLRGTASSGGGGQSTVRVLFFLFLVHLLVRNDFLANLESLPSPFLVNGGCCPSRQKPCFNASVSPAGGCNKGTFLIRLVNELNLVATLDREVDTFALND